MIYDRTQQDVDAAVSIRNMKVKTFQELSDEEISTLERGTLTINTLNRIENKQEELKNIFNDVGYWDTPTINKTWNYTDIFNEDEFQRIIDNTNVLREAFFTYTDTPKTPPVSYYFEDINSLERILNDLEIMTEDMRGYYRECDVFYCGEE